MKKLILLSIVLLEVTFLSAQPGTLDKTIRSDGSMGESGFITFSSGQTDEINDLIIQSDGKILLAGNAFNGTDWDFSLIRLLSDGSPDPSFGINGKVVQAIGSSNDMANAIALQTDGKIILAGQSDNGSNDDFAVVRFNSDGTIDNSFDTDGMATFEIGTTDDIATSIAIQDDGKIVLAGRTGYFPNISIAVLRCNTDGSLDTGFDLDGKIMTTINPSIAQANSVAIQIDGKIIVGGTTGMNTTLDFCLVRYNTDGSLDTGFDTDGKVVSSLGGNDDEAMSIKIQSDGKILAAGYTHNGNDWDFALARYNTNGTLDATFGGGSGYVTTFFNGLSDDLANDMIIQTDNKIVLVGYTHNGTDEDIAVIRYNDNGVQDATFHSDGKLTTVIQQNGNERGNAIAIQTDGNILVAGYTGSFPDKKNVLVRYHTDGQPDTYYDNTGYFTQKFGADLNEKATSVAVQNDGKIVVGGDIGVLNDVDFSIIRYNIDGTMDSTFNDSGWVSTYISDQIDRVVAVQVQKDGKIVALGSSNSDFVLARYHSDGSLDNTFDGDGIVITDIESSSSDLPMNLYITPNNKIIASGYYSGATKGSAILRYNEDGSLDSDFSGDGIFIVDLGSQVIQLPEALAVQPDGKILIGGYFYNGTDYDIGIARVDTNGVLDNSFDTDGLVSFDFNTNFSVVKSLALQPDGAILVAGAWSPDGVEFHWSIARLNQNGSMDNTFSGDGRAYCDFGQNDDMAVSVMVQPDGKIVTAGYTLAIPANDYGFALARLNSNGSPDNSFGSSSQVLTNMRTEDDRINAAIFQEDGKILTAGYSRESPRDDLAIARYMNYPPFQSTPLTASEQTTSTARLSWENGPGNRKVVFVRRNDLNGMALPVDGQQYSPDTAFGNGEKLGASDWYCVYDGTDTTVVISELEMFVEYKAVIYDYNMYPPTYNSDSTAGNMINFIADGPPTVQTDQISTVDITDTSFSITFNPGNGIKRQVWVTQNTTGTCSPVDGDTYTANDEFGLGSELSGWYCAYDGSGSSASIFGLSPNTSYRLHICEYVDFSTTKYLTTSATDNPVNLTTDVTTPSVQASDIEATNVQDDNFTLSWTKGDGTNSIVFLKEDNSGKPEIQQNQTYNASETFKDGNQIGTSGWYCVHNGTDTFVQVTNLSVNREYIAMVSTYNGAGGNEKYDTTSSSNNINVFNTVYDAPTTQSSDIEIVLDNGTASLSWQVGDGYRRAVFISETDILGTPSPENGTNYNGNSEIGAGDQIGSSSWYCIYSGFGDNVDITGVKPATPYKIMICEFNGTTGAESYLTNSVTGNPVELFTPVEICLVTADWETGKNMVIWEDDDLENIVLFKIYREEISQDNYVIIDSLNFGEIPIYLDLTSQPENKSHKYKISAVDSSGYETQLSPSHQTMLLSSTANTSNGITLEWTPYTVDGEEFTFESYIIYRGITDSILDSLDIIPSGNQTMYIDNSPLAGQNYYRVEGIKSGGPCDPANLLKANSGPFSRSVSNLEDNRQRGTNIGLQNSGSDLIIYPNPMMESCIVRFNNPNNHTYTFTVRDVTGKLMFVEKEINAFWYEFNNEELSPGLYFIELRGENIYRGQIIIE